MVRVQIQLPKPLEQQLKGIAGSRDISFAELCRRGLERYADQWAESETNEPKGWTFPTLPENAMNEEAALNRQESIATDLRAQ